MKKEEKEIAVNKSSGAEKVEKIEKKTGAKGKTTRKTVAKTAKAPTPETAKGEAALGSAKKAEVSEKASRETKAAKARVDRALAKKKKAAEKKAAREKRRAEKKAKIEKHAAERKAIAEKRAAERKARVEKRKAEREERIRQRAHKKANRNQAASKRKAKRSKERKEGANKGYGGWIAAVVSLGVVSLALATTVTVGAMDLKATKEGAMTGYKGTMYELTGIMENVDDDLDRARISDSPAQQSRILTDLLVQTRLAELDLEKLPISIEQNRNVTEFINRTAMECERMLAKLRNGEALSTSDHEVLERLYKTNHAIKEEVNAFMEKMTDKDLKAYIKDGVGSVKDAMEKLDNLTLEENRSAHEKGEKDAHKTPSKKEEERIGIDPMKAIELCKDYFTAYNIGEYNCVGETVTSEYSAYNIQGYDDAGTMLFAEVSQKDGTLLRFDYYEDCMQETFDRSNAEKIADEFLEKLGYEDLEVARAIDNGSTTDFTYVYEDDGVLYYPDEIHVKVCRTRGTVSGFDATDYMQNHRDRVEMNPKISMQTAADQLHDGLTMEASTLCLVDTARGERLAYEFLCGYDNQTYFVYIDAENGGEIAIFNTKNLYR